MYFRVILSAGGLAVAFSIAPGQAEVLAVDSTFAINGMATIGDPPILSGDIDVAGGPPAGILKFNRRQLFPSIHSISIPERPPAGSSPNLPRGRRPFSALWASVDDVLLQC